MTIREYPKGSIIYKSGEPISSISFLTKGSVQARLGNHEFLLKQGDALGLLDFTYGIHSVTYMAASDITVCCYPGSSGELPKAIFSEKPEIAVFFIASMTQQLCSVLEYYTSLTVNTEQLYQYIRNSYEQYNRFCREFPASPKLLPDIEDLSPLTPEISFEAWVLPYYQELKRLEPAVRKSFFDNHLPLSVGFLKRACAEGHQAITGLPACESYGAQLACLLLNQEGFDLFGLFTDLYLKSLSVNREVPSLEGSINELILRLDDNPFIDPVLRSTRVRHYREALVSMQNSSNIDTLNPQSFSIRQELQNSLRMILDYAGIPEDTAKEYIKYLDAYKKLKDRNSSEDQARILRRELTRIFHELYSAVFPISNADSEIPVIVKMFLYFGYLDEELAGRENAEYLYALAQTKISDPEKGIYTLYDWMLAIYSGSREPSRNEFDLDFGEYIHSLKTSSRITAAEEKQMLQDQAQKVLFELNNMFPLVNKMTFGRVTTYTPVLSEHNIFRTLSSSLVRPEMVLEEVGHLRQVDYSLFYREVLYSDANNGIQREMLQQEILPDVILMPNIGSRGVLWQEIEGKKRNTPCRMMLSIFSSEQIRLLLTRMAGEYRWEMCKRVQGARWNDMGEPSLTSEYCDYMQFYKKNRDLSQDTKEAVTSELQRARNNFRDAFVANYVDWMMYECNGASRLNRTARKILATYCPFSAKIREKLKLNPTYAEFIKKHALRQVQKTEQMNRVIQKLQKTGMTVPKEFMEYLEFLKQ